MPEIVYGRWNPSEIRDRIMDNTWTTVELVTGMEKIVPTSINFSGQSASLNPSTGLVTFNNVSFIRVNGIFSNTYYRYKLHSEISGNVFEGVNIRCRVSSGNDLDYSVGGGYSWMYRLATGSSISGTQNGSDTSWLFDIVTQQGFKEISHFFRAQGSGYLGFLKQGLYDDNVRDDFTYAQLENGGFTTGTGSWTSLYFFPQNNLEFMSGTMMFYGYD